MPQEGSRQLDIAHLDKVFGLLVEVGGKVVEDLDEAGANGFPLGLGIFQTLHAIALLADVFPASISSTLPRQACYVCWAVPASWLHIMPVAAWAAAEVGMRYLQAGQHAFRVVNFGDWQVQVVLEGVHHPVAFLHGPQDISKTR